MLALMFFLLAVISLFFYEVKSIYIETIASVVWYYNTAYYNFYIFFPCVLLIASAFSFNKIASGIAIFLTSYLASQIIFKQVVEIFYETEFDEWEVYAVILSTIIISLLIFNIYKILKSENPVIIFFILFSAIVIANTPLLFHLLDSIRA